MPSSRDFVRFINKHKLEYSMVTVAKPHIVCTCGEKIFFKLPEGFIHWSTKNIEEYLAARQEDHQTEALEEFWETSLEADNQAARDRRNETEAT